MSYSLNVLKTDKKIILASNSPRRHEILLNAGIPHQVESAMCQEQYSKGMAPVEVVKKLSMDKAMDVFERCENKDEVIVIGADTVVSQYGIVYGKPKSDKDAFNILQNLSGKSHDVYTGVAIVATDRKQNFAVKTEVTFNPLSSEFMKEYIATGEPMDKAGAYGIQGMGAIIVKDIKGDYYNVLGLPLCAIINLLNNSPIR